MTIFRNLSRREELREDRRRADADVFVVEIKAAGIDVSRRAAGRSRTSPVVFADNDVVSLEGQPNLDDELLALGGNRTAGARALMPERRRFDPLHLGTDEHPY